MSTKVFKNLLMVPLALIFLACSVFTPQPTPEAADMEKEEQAVYSFFMQTSGTTLILQDTSTNITDDTAQQTMDYIKSDLKGISRETLNNYLERNEQPGQLAPDMDLGADYLLLDSKGLAKITRQPNWHEILKEKYPTSEGYIVFSRVGFNRTLDQALIYVGRVRGPLMGAGYYYLMGKIDGEWRIKEEIMVWIS
jgi:hypothetical protein